MRTVLSMFVACAGMLVATVAPLRADFISTATLTASADGATNSTGTGTAMVDWMSATNTFSYTLSWTGLTGPATMAHIHIGGVGTDGPIVLPFFMSTMPASDSITGTLTAADFIPDTNDGVNTIADVATAIQLGFAYVNVHTAMYPAGEIRGQLAVSNTATPEPATAGLMLLSLAGGIGFFARRRLSASR